MTPSSLRRAFFMSARMANLQRLAVEFSQFSSLQCNIRSLKKIHMQVQDGQETAARRPQAWRAFLLGG
jgi:hypothetical protein